MICPSCQVPLVTEYDQVPWCARCEWQLDHFPKPHLDWPWGHIARIDRRLGFRADRKPQSLPTTTGAAWSEWLLRLVSLLLVLAQLAVVGFGIWLMVANSFFGPTVIAFLVLLGIAYLMRPRLGRLKPILEYHYVITAEKQPALFGLLRRVADATGARMPDHVALAENWNAFVGVLGLRRRRVMVLGIPLLAALRPQERVALIAHEFGHLAHEDSLRQLIVQPALTHFGMLARTVRAPRTQDPMGGLLGMFMMVWIVVGGIISLFLTGIHIGLNILGARESRRAELRADRMAARAAGTAAAMSTMDVLACERELSPFVGPGAEPGRVMQSWHSKVQWAREHIHDRVGRLRQLTNRTQAGLFSSHPPPDRRHRYLGSLPYESAAVVVTEAESERIDIELGPYGEALRKELQEQLEGL